MRYVKRPVEIAAVRWDGENIEDIRQLTSGSREVVHDPDSHSLLVHTLEGRMRCAPGDYLIRGIKDEFYPCRADIFEATYEAVDVLEVT